VDLRHYYRNLDYTPITRGSFTFGRWGKNNPTPRLKPLNFKGALYDEPDHMITKR